MSETAMNIAILTPTLYERTSSYNHLLQDLIEAFLQEGHRITRFIACEKGVKTPHVLQDHIVYHEMTRAKVKKSSFLMRYLIDTLTTMKLARNMRRVDGLELLLEHMSICSFWNVRAANKKNLKIVLMVQDIWPDNAVACGLFRKNTVRYRVFEWMQTYVYRHVDQIICISEDMRQCLQNKGIARKHIAVIYNWSSQDAPVAIPWHQNVFVREHHLSEQDTHVIYAGNIGAMQNVDVILRAAQLLQDQVHIQFYVIGEGARKAHIERQAFRMKRVHCLSMLPEERAQEVYSAASINIIPLVQGGIQTAMPSKTALCLRCGRPIIFCIDSDSLAAENIRKYHAGIVVDSDDAHALARAILQLIQFPGTCDQTGMRRYFLRNFTKQENIKQYCACIAALEQKAIGYETVTGQYGLRNRQHG